MKKTIFIILSIFILSFMLLFFFTPKSEFSENENRYLEKIPKFTFSSLEDGSYINNLEEYLTDHFNFRDFFVGFKTKIEKLTGKKVINDVYLGDEGYLLTKYNKINSEKLVDKLNKFNENNSNKNISLLLIPSSISVYKEKLPPYAITDSELEVIEDIYSNVNFKTIDVYDDLMNAKKDYQVFYKTDHHYTTYGAYYTYLAYCRANNIVPITTNNFKITTVTDNFYGTLYSKVNDYTLGSDKIDLFLTDTSYEVNYADTNITQNTLYNYEYLNKKDKYAVFLDNNHPLITITNKDIQNDFEILVIKDSFGNSFIPFLAEHYHKVHVVDLRYNLNSMTDYLDKNSNIDNVLVIYSISTINDDSSIYNLR